MSAPVYPTLRTARLTSPFGWRIHPTTGERAFHHGIDLAAPTPGQTGVPIYATMDGVVRVTGRHSTMGNYIYLQHSGDSFTSSYLHLASFSVSQGTTVTKGQRIGTMGTTGRSTGIHLDFGISTRYPPSWNSPGSFIDPEGYLEGSADSGANVTPISGNRYLNREEMANNAEYVYAYLSTKGWTKNAIAGMLGNMESESTINPGIWQNLNSYESTPYITVDRQGYGLVQWTPFNKYTIWARDNGLTYSDMNAQLDRIEYEVQNGIQWIATNDYPLSFVDFKTSTESPEYLGMAFLRNYERPLDQNQPERGTQARYWYDNLTGTGIITPDNPQQVKSDALIHLWLSDALNGWQL